MANKILTGAVIGVAVVLGTGCEALAERTLFQTLCDCFQKNNDQAFTIQSQASTIEDLEAKINAAPNATEDSPEEQ